MQQRSISQAVGNNSNQLIHSLLGSEEKHSVITRLSRTLQDGTKAFLKNSRRGLLMLLLSQQASADIGRNDSSSSGVNINHSSGMKMVDIYIICLVALGLLAGAGGFYCNRTMEINERIRNAIEGDGEAQNDYDIEEPQEGQGAREQQEDLEMQRAEGKPKNEPLSDLNVPLVGKGIQPGEDDHPPSHYRSLK